MLCYYCESEPPAGGTRLKSSSAVAICTECGVGLCQAHAQRQADRSARVLCPQCTENATTSKVRSAS